MRSAAKNEKEYSDMVWSHWEDEEQSLWEDIFIYERVSVQTGEVCHLKDGEIG